MFGEGMARITECDLVNFAPVTVLYNLMHVSFGAQKPTGTALVYGRLEGVNLAITTARIFNRGIEIRGLGEVRDIWNVPNSPIQGSAVGSAQPLANIKLPFMADVTKIFSVLQANVTSVRFSGTLKKPDVVQSTLDDVGQAMRSLLLGDVEAQTRGSAQR
jgi:hypothetical protein